MILTNVLIFNDFFSTSPTSMDDEDEMLKVEEEPVEDIDDPDVHPLKCLPGVPEVHSGMIPMSCKDREDRDPITVLVSAEGFTTTIGCEIAVFQIPTWKYCLAVEYKI